MVPASCEVPSFGGEGDESTGGVPDREMNWLVEEVVGLCGIPRHFGCEKCRDLLWQAVFADGEIPSEQPDGIMIGRQWRVGCDDRILLHHRGVEPFQPGL
jgi:hypothetical protein